MIWLLLLQVLVAEKDQTEAMRLMPLLADNRVGNLPANGRYEYWREGLHGVILTLPEAGTDGQECLESLMKSALAQRPFCPSPRYVDVYLEDGSRLRVDRANGETIR